MERRSLLRALLLAPAARVASRVLGRSRAATGLPARPARRERNVRTVDPTVRHEWRVESVSPAGLRVSINGQEVPLDPWTGKRIHWLA